MSATQEPPARAPLQQEAQQLLRVWKTPSGFRYWSSVNNNDVGIWYTAAAFIFFLFGGVLALLMRIQLATPDNTFLSADRYNQIFTVHGSVMMFLFGIPIFEAIAVTLMPQMLGARDLPFPRLAAFGFWCFVLGGLFLCGSLFFNSAPQGGWFMYPPLTSAYQPGIGPDIWLLGFSFIEIAAIASAIELIVGALKCRPPGMQLHLMPLYVWYTLVASIMIVFAFPPLIAGSLLLEVERAFGWPFFDPTRGGDPILWQHLFWLFGHPEVYVIFLPSIALVAMVIPTFARRPIVGYSWIVLAAIGTGFLSFGLWVHHMYTVGLPSLSLSLFSAASTAVAIPTAVQFFCFFATLLASRNVRSTPMLWVLGGVATFVLGGLTGVMIAIAPFDFQAHDTFFIVGHLHYVLIGGAIFPILAGLYYFFPLIAGKELSTKLGKVAFWIVFVGFNIAFLPMHLTGLRGMPRRVFTYPAGLGFDTLNLVSTVGAFLLATGFAVIVWDVVRPKGKQPLAQRNLWQAGTLEWVQEMPGMDWGIRSIPEVKSRYPLWDDPDLIRKIDAGEYYLPDAAEGLRETLITSVVEAKPEQCQRLPGSSFIPLLAALALGGFFAFGTFHLWLAATVSLVLAVGIIVYWLWTSTALIPEKANKHVGLGLHLPIYVSGAKSIGYWAMFVMMLADITAFISLVFGYFFFWTVHDNFPPEPVLGPGVQWPALALAAAAGAWVLSWVAHRAHRRDRVASFHAAWVLSIVLTGCALVAIIAGPYTTRLDPTHHAYEAIVWMLALWTAFHLAVDILMRLYCSARRICNRMTATHDIDLHNTRLYGHFIFFTTLTTVIVIAGFPSLT